MVNLFVVVFHPDFCIWIELDRLALYSCIYYQHFFSNIENRIRPPFVGFFAREYQHSNRTSSSRKMSIPFSHQSYRWGLDKNKRNDSSVLIPSYSRVMQLPQQHTVSHFAYSFGHIQTWHRAVLLTLEIVDIYQRNLPCWKNSIKQNIFPTIPRRIFLIVNY